MLDGGAQSWAMWMQFNRVEFEAPVAGSVTDQTKDYVPGLGSDNNEMNLRGQPGTLPGTYEGSAVPIRCLVRSHPLYQRAQEGICDGYVLLWRAGTVRVTRAMPVCALC